MRFADDWEEYNDIWRWPNFTPREMADSETGQLLIDDDFMDWLQKVREVYGYPMIINSGYRTPKHQKSISGRTSGAHVDGMAVDVRVYGARAHRLQKVAYSLNVSGVGVSQNHPDKTKRYIHLDRWKKAPEGFRPNCWSY